MTYIVDDNTDKLKTFTSLEEAKEFALKVKVPAIRRFKEGKMGQSYEITPLPVPIVEVEE